MPSVRTNPLINQTGVTTSLRYHAMEQSLRPPVSLRHLLAHVDQRSFHSTITSAGLEALGGTVDLTIRSDGTYDIHVHLHDSGLIDYSFRVVVLLSGAGPTAVLSPEKEVPGTAILFECSGEVEGTESTIPFEHEPRRDYDWRDSGYRSILREFWLPFKDGQMNVSKAYQHGGVVGAIEDVAGELFTFLLGTAVLAMPPVAAIALVSSTIGRLTGERFLGPGGLVGLASAMGTYYLFGPTLVFPAFLGGTIIGELALPGHRLLEPDEIDFAKKVFGDTIPYERIRLTDLVGIGNRPFAFPGLDGSILLNIGREAFADPIRYARDSNKRCKDKPGQMFIHELTHAWQIANGSLEGFICDAAIGSRLGELTAGKRAVYTYGSADGDWSSYFNMEQQASLVEEWFGGTNCSRFDRDSDDPRIAMNTQDPYFRFIAGNIRLGVA
ncbi:MAG TPA: hypothetical protein VMN57_10715 [Anaerolineales bacterium]|nr:hypothetical protein [Anaerolineales bacterium]